MAARRASASTRASISGACRWRLMSGDRRLQFMPRLKVLGTVIGLAAVLVSSNGYAQDVTLAPAEPVKLEISDYALPPAGTIVTWRDLLTGKTLEEKVEAADGLMMKSRVGGRRAFAYLPDP